MKLVFADTIYWVALINPKDQWRGPALSAQSSFHNVRLVTTDVILLEVLNFFAEHGEEARRRAVSATEEILTNPHTENRAPFSRELSCRISPLQSSRRQGL